MRACEEQTSKYDWSGHLQAVSDLLGLTIREAGRELPRAMLHALFDILPLLQCLPEDRFCHIEGLPGVSLVTVWAHHVLGLTVLVKSPRGNTHCFGVGKEQVYIDGEQINACITLFDSSLGSMEPLFLLKPEEDIPINSYLKSPVRGYGQLQLRDHCEAIAFQCDAAFIDDMKLVVLAVTQIIAKHLWKDMDATGNSSTQKHMTEKHILRAAQLIFHDPDLTFHDAEPYLAAYSSRALNEDLVPPGLIAAALQNNRNGDGLWRGCLSIAKTLGILILTLAHVQDLGTCELLPLGNCDLLCLHNLFNQMREWNGKDRLMISGSTWFEALALLVTGHKTDNEAELTSLISDRGWSIYMASYSKADPILIDVGRIGIANGVPSRNGVRREGVVDGPGIWTSKGAWFGKVADGTQEVDLNLCANNLAAPRSMFGERGGYFAVSLVYDSKVMLPELRAEQNRLRTGYRALHDALWAATKLSSCSHGGQQQQLYTLPLGCATFAGFPDDHTVHLVERITILLTAHDSASRWRALIGARMYLRDLTRDQIPHTLHIGLRGRDCCFACVIQHFLKEPGKWIVIL